MPLMMASWLAETYIGLGFLKTINVLIVSAYVGIVSTSVNKPCTVKMILSIKKFTFSKVMI